MLKIEKTVTPSPEQWEIIIEGMRNPKNSWERSDSEICKGASGYEDCTGGITGACPRHDHFAEDCFCLGQNDHDLMMRLAKGGRVHAKYRRMIPVWVTVTAPLYWWKEYDTYKVGTVANSCSTMHKIHAKEFTLDDFSHEHMIVAILNSLKRTIEDLNACREGYLSVSIDDPEWKKEIWWQMIQLLPASYNQKRTLMLNYEVLCNIYHSRKDHKLDEWHTFCDWIKTLPYAELITGEDEP